MNKMYVYFKDSRRVVGKYSSDQKLEVLYYNDAKMLTMLDSIQSEDDYEDYSNYKVVNGELIRFSDNELVEIQIYSRVLTEDERVLNKLKPSHDEVKKAENTIDILSVLQGVLE